ncbi:MAG TPA: glycine cleavage T C-terminal barrel domain-containing protein [Longimicrobiales bacterium]|nr:glycine cleavage T C-terminal barrel domain-containing protein [Longimicrobiales bacterium]
MEEHGVAPRDEAPAAEAVMDEYEAARTGAVVADRAERVFLRAYGRDPVRMLQGLITNDLAGAPEGRGVYAAFLTPKGRMIADAWLFRVAGGEALLELDAAAAPGLREHLKRSVPPLFARFEEAPLAALGVYGPRAAEVVRAVLGAVPPGDAAEGESVAGTWGGAEWRIVRSLETGEPGGYELIGAAESAPGVREALVAAGARPAGPGTLEVLRIEAGRPRWGAELDETVLPLEAGLKERAISTTKGCYTGQEVVIRILHRGHVNRHLRGVLLGDAPAPARGAPLVRPADGKVVGTVTAACASPRLGQTIALAYVRREVEPGGAVRVGVDGDEGRVVEPPFPA